MKNSFTLGPARLALGTGAAVDGRLVVKLGRIAGILAANGPSDVTLPSGSTVAPGLIEVHTNGADDSLFNRDQGGAVEIASRAYARVGATSFVASIMTAPWESMLHAASDVAEAAHALAERPAEGARCIGIHVEGPFLNPKYRGVHRPEWLRGANVAAVHELIEACRGALSMVTMAPEVDGVREAVPELVGAGVVCSAGHTSGHYRDGIDAIALGFRTLTHAFNGMPPLGHRDPSLLAAFMRDERTTVQVICDGYHVVPEMIDLLHRLFGERLVLASDYMAPAGAGYRIEGGVMRAEDGTIAGSALHVDEAVRNLMRFANLPFERAIVNATASPARLLGLERERGTLATGARADLSIWNERYEPVATIVGGDVVYGAHIVRIPAPIGTG